MSSSIPPVTVESLLAHREWVRHLSRKLVLDPGTADDLVQQTWLRALRSPPPDGSAPRAWLATVMRNLLKDHARGTERRDRREKAVARREELPTTLETVARAEALGRVVQAVLALEEPYRTTVLLRFFEGLPANDVAERMGVPAGTVRTRQRRALERLREQLADVYRAEKADWRAALLPLAGLDEEALAAAMRPPSSGVARIAKGAALVVGTAGVFWLTATLLLPDDPPSAAPVTIATEPQDIATEPPGAAPVADETTPPERASPRDPPAVAPVRQGRAGTGDSAAAGPVDGPRPPPVQPRDEGAGPKPPPVKPRGAPPDPDATDPQENVQPEVPTPPQSAVERPAYADDATRTWEHDFNGKLRFAAKRFRSLADWCEGNGLGWTSLRVRRRVLRYLPDEAATRAFFGYRSVAGAWVRDEVVLDRLQTEFIDQDDPSNPAYGRSYASVQKQVSATFRLLARRAGREARETESADAQRTWRRFEARAWGRVLELAPGVAKHKEEAHEALGHPEFEGRRVTPFHARHLEVRAERLRAARAIAATEPRAEVVPLTGVLEKAGIEGAAAQSEHFLVNSAHGPEVALRQVRAAEWAIADAIQVYGFPADLGSRLPLRVLHGLQRGPDGGRAQLRAVLVAAGWEEDRVQSILRAGFGGTALSPGERVATSTDGGDAEDGVMNMVTAACAQAAADLAAEDVGRRLSVPEDWLWQSMATDCTKRVLGSASTVWGALGRYGQRQAARPDQDVWMELAREQVEMDEDVPLARLHLLALRDQEFGGRELVKGHAFLQFLFESDAKKAREFVRHALPLGTPHAAMVVYGEEILGPTGVPEMPAELAFSGRRRPLPAPFRTVLDELDARYHDWIVRAWDN